VESPSSILGGPDDERSRPSTAVLRDRGPAGCEPGTSGLRPPGDAPSRSGHAPPIPLTPGSVSKHRAVRGTTAAERDASTVRESDVSTEVPESSLLSRSRRTLDSIVSPLLARIAQARSREEGDGALTPTEPSRNESAPDRTTAAARHVERRKAPSAMLDDLERRLAAGAISPRDYQIWQLLAVKLNEARNALAGPPRRHAPWKRAKGGAVGLRAAFLAAPGRLARSCAAAVVAGVAGLRRIAAGIRPAADVGRRVALAVATGAARSARTGRSGALRRAEALARQASAIGRRVALAVAAGAARSARAGRSGALRRAEALTRQASAIGRRVELAVGAAGTAIAARATAAIHWRPERLLRLAGAIAVPAAARRLRRIVFRLPRVRVPALPVRSVVVVLLLVGAGAAAITFGLADTATFYALFVGVSLVLGAFCTTTLVWMLDAWRTPEAFARTRLESDHLRPRFSFSLVVPARHEEAVLATTLSRLVTSDHPDFEVLVVVGHDDPQTAAVAERVAARHPELIRVVVDDSPTKNKPRALNAALPHCAGEITGVFDAEDDVHPDLLKRVDQRFQRTGADVVQAGVQLMNFSSSWYAVRNVLEYYFWFRSRLHAHSRQGFIPLGGNTVFVRTEVLQAVGGWDPECLTEDCEIGVRLSSLGAKTVVVYEPELVTREECPTSLRAFIRQRTRWNQGFLQTLERGYWRRLPLRQQLLGVYILAMPYLLAIAWLLIPAAIATAVAVTAPVPITLISILPALPMLSILAVEFVGLNDFCQMYGERAGARDYARLVFGLPFYQVVLAFAAACAVLREAVGVRGWQKTTHFGVHLGLHVGPPTGRATGWPRIPSRRSRLPESRRPVGRRPGDEAKPQPETSAARRPESLAGGFPLVMAYMAAQIEAVAQRRDEKPIRRPAMLARAALAGGGEMAPTLPLDGLVGARSGESLLARLRSRAASAEMPVASVPAAAPVLPRIGARVWGLARSRVDAALLVPLLVGAGLLQYKNMLHWPGVFFDEGTYISNAWAVQAHGVLSNYTYGYGHPPLAWLLITLWTWASGLFGHAIYSVDNGRELMLPVGVVSCWLLYVLARRLRFARGSAALAVILFTLSPLSLFFHRLVLLDNFATAWALAAFVLALTPTRRLWAYAGSGACFAASVLSKETTLVLLPALVLTAVQFADRRTRRYCLVLFASFFALLGASYPLYAALKGELLPGRGHVSLLGEVLVQLFTRKTTGSVFNTHSLSYGTLHFWLQVDPWLVLGALALSPFALARRNTRAVAVAYLIQALMVARPGYLPAMYVIAMLPFAALIVAGCADVLFRFATSWSQERPPSPSTGRWRSVALRLRPAALAAAALTLAASALGAVQFVGRPWLHTDRQALTARLDTANHAAETWLVRHVGHEKRILVTDEIWIYLIEHGFNAQPMKGGFYSRTVVFYWPLDYDPAVERAFPQGWRDFDYIVSTPDVRNTAYLTPNTALALRHSKPVATFGEGGNRIEIRKIVASAPASTHAHAHAARVKSAKHRHAVKSAKHRHPSATRVRS
jgi:cellulose synthase/poly-beta-1,6-N-acetylglucosamine synthase-like glycosyltransferase